MCRPGLPSSTALLSLSFRASSIQGPTTTTAGDAKSYAPRNLGKGSWYVKAAMDGLARNDRRRCGDWQRLFLRMRVHYATSRTVHQRNQARRGPRFREVETGRARVPRRRGNDALSFYSVILSAAKNLDGSCRRTAQPCSLRMP